MKSDNINYVIFDMDGVIVDSHETHLDVEKQIFSDYGADIPGNELESYYGLDEKEFFQQIFNDYEIEGDPVGARERKRDIMNNKELDSVQEMNGALEAIEYCKNNYEKIAVASASGRNVVESFLESLDVLNEFDQVVSSEEKGIENGKPSPDIFEKTADRLGAEPEETVVIEDTMNGVKAAKEAGMYCILYPGDEEAAELSDEKVESMDEITSLL